MEKLDGKSLDITKENIKAIKQLFPEVVTEWKIDFDKLKLILGEEIDDRNEKYEFTWHGKAKSLKLAQTPSTGTLLPDKASSKNWDTTENFYIEGDNLEVLKLLQKAYFGKIKMIYIDPPYNTGKDFVYKDDFRDNLKNYKEVTKQTFKINPETNGRYHTNWLNMMYPRIRLARNLLSNDGAIFISIDDNELSNIRKICDEVFGEENLFAQIIVQSNKRGQTYKQISKTHEYLLVYTKNNDTEFNELPKTEENSDLNLEDLIGRFNIRELRNRNPKFGKFNRPKLFYPFYVNPEKVDKDGFCPVSLEKNEEFCIEVFPYNSTGKESCWRWGKELSAANINIDTLRSNLVAKRKNDGNYNIYEKYRKDTYKPKSIWDDVSFITEKGTVELRELGLSAYFDFPKPKELIKQALMIGTNKNDIVLDFFSGSATTAHAVMQLNAEDGGNRKFIMVQLPELTDEKSDAYKAGYKNICEIGKERIRRAGDKIVEETGKTDLDIGFKVFKLDSSNIKLWDPETANLEQGLFDLQDNIKEGRSKEDLLYEILLKIGIPLTMPIEEVKVNDKVIYNVGFGGVLLCLEDEIDLDIVHEIIKLKPEDFDTKVVFKETGFLNDSVKTNAIQTLKKNGITDVRSV